MGIKESSKKKPQIGNGVFGLIQQMSLLFIRLTTASVKTSEDSRGLKKKVGGDGDMWRRL